MSTRIIKRSAVVVLLLASMALTVTASPVATQAAPPPLTTLQGYLIAAPLTTTVPVVLLVQTRTQGIYQVAVSSTTRVVRRYGALSGLDELAANDVLQIHGQKTGSGAFTATLIRDNTLQAADTRLVGLVTSVSATSVSVIVEKDLKGQAPFSVGTNMTLPVGATTTVISGTTIQTGTTTLLTAGAEVLALGTFDRISHSFTAIFRLRVTKPATSPGTGTSTTYDGYLVTAPVTTTLPVNLTVQTLHRGVITVTVTAVTTLVRKYGAPSGLDEFSANDVLHIVGAPVTAGQPQTIVARSLRDESIQAAYTRVVGQVTSVSATAVTIVVRKDTTGHSPLIPGQNLVLPLSSSTKVTGTLAIGARVTALGVFNTNQHLMLSTARIHVM